MSDPNTLVPSRASSGEHVSNDDAGIKQLPGKLYEQAQEQQETYATRGSPPSLQEKGNAEDSSGSDSGKEKEEPVQWKMPTRSWLVFMTLCVLTVMVALDGTSISVALPVRLSGSIRPVNWGDSLAVLTN